MEPPTGMSKPKLPSVMPPLAVPPAELVLPPDAVEVLADEAASPQARVASVAASNAARERAEWAAQIIVRWPCGGMYGQGCHDCLAVARATSSELAGRTVRL